MTAGKTCQIAGCAVQLTAVTSGALVDLQSALGAASATLLPASFTLHIGPSGMGRPDRPPDRVVQHVATWSEGDVDVVSTSPAQLARVGPDRAVLDVGANGVRGIHALLLPVLALMFARRGLCVAHAAAYVEPKVGGAVLALGGSGQGKSTMIAAALSTGRDVLSDDLVVLCLHPGGEVTVSGVPQPLALPGDLDHEVVGAAMDGDPRHRRAPAAAVTLDPGWHPVRSVILLGHSAQPEGHLSRANQRDAFYQLLTSTMEGLSETTARHAFPFAAGVAKVPASHLGHAADPVRRVAAAERWLAEANAEALRRGPDPTG